MKPPFTLGLEFAGVVVSSPPNSPFPPGTRVFGGASGSFATLISVPSTSLFPIPPSFSFAGASGISATAPVSYGALITRGGLKKGETVLIHAAAGGLGLMAVQIAKAVGARVIATAGSAAKLDVARRFGADEALDYTSGKWWEDVLKLTDGQGVDVVYDSVGLVNQSLSCLKHKGRVLIVGFAGREGDMEGVKMNRVLLKQAQLIGYVSLFYNLSLSRQPFSYLSTLQSHPLTKTLPSASENPTAGTPPRQKRSGPASSP